MSSKIDFPISGVLPVLHTPFTASGDIDVEVLRKEIDWAFSVGANGVVMAMVSEVLRLGHHGRLELAGRICELAKGHGAIIISVGAESIRDAIDYARHAEALGATAVMAIPPIATRLGSRATIDYFSAIASEIDIALVVQDASSYVGASIDLDVYIQLLQRFGPEKILFKPEASPLGPNLSRLRVATGGQAKVLEGSGGICLVDCYRRGIVGTMPGTDLLDGIVALWNALEANDDERIYEIAFPISAVVALQLQAGLDGFLAIEKYLLQKRGIFRNTLQRQPVGWVMDDETQLEVDRLFARLMAALAA
ncbi:dihydrodipicolinate synthase family protein [Pirellulaceae bacterium SH449]